MLPEHALGEPDGCRDEARAMASDRVLSKTAILEDVVVSFDRNHRGRIVQLLQDEFAGRQVIVFTHDRDGARTCDISSMPKTGTSEACFAVFGQNHEIKEAVRTYDHLPVIVRQSPDQQRAPACPRRFRSSSSSRQPPSSRPRAQGRRASWPASYGAASRRQACYARCDRW